MCGICGFTGEKKDNLLKKMGDAIYHRGPDEEGLFSNNLINLCSRRLSIIDIKSGKQPVKNESGMIFAVWNGEIYNYLELRRALEDKGHSFYTDHSDSEVIVHLYEEYGLNFPAHINGMFAIAIWDQNNETLVLVRDRMGVKPLFYAEADNNLVFGSEIKSILLHPDIKKEKDYDALYHYFTYKNIVPPKTAFKEIRSLMPGEMLIYSKKKKVLKTYWQADFSKKSLDSIDEAELKIHDILMDATKIRMRSDVEVGAFLSGGLDSSLIVALAQRHSSKKLKTFSLGYNMETKLFNKAEDIQSAKLISEMFETDHYEYFMNPMELIDNLDSILHSFDQPFAGVSSTFFLTRLISKHVKVALSGDGADELFGSYLAPRLAFPMEYYAANCDIIEKGMMSDNQKNNLKPFENNIMFLQELLKGSNGELAKWKYKLLPFDDKKKKQLLSNGFKGMISEGTDSYRLLKSQIDSCNAKDVLNRVLENEWNTLLPNQVLAFVDFLSMAHSVEVRSPFLDYRLIDYVATLPGSYKIVEGNVKHLLKNVARGIIPDQIINRKKEGFVLPIYEWMQTNYKEYVTDVLSKENLQKYNLLDCKYVDSMLTNYYIEQNKSNSMAGEIWELVIFQNWCNLYL